MDDNRREQHRAQETLLRFVQSTRGRFLQLRLTTTDNIYRYVEMSEDTVTRRMSRLLSEGINAGDPQEPNDVIEDF